MTPASDRINELRALMTTNSRRNNEIYRKTNQLDQPLLYENIRIRNELGRLETAKNMDVSALA